MKVLDSYRICSDFHQRIFFLRIDPEKITNTLAYIFEELSNLSWIEKFDEEYTRNSFKKRAESTLRDIEAKISISSDDPVSSDAAEYVVSELAREAIISEMNYLNIPLAELYNKKKCGNPGFDFHTQTNDDVIVFGEAKYLANRNAFGSGLRQIVRFVSEEKDIKDLVDLRDFCSDRALCNVDKGTKGFAVAFSAKSNSSDSIIESIIKNKDFLNLCKYEEIILVAVNI